MPVFLGHDISLEERNDLHRSLYAKFQVAQYIYDAEANDTVWNILRNHIMDDTLSIVLCASSQDAIWRIVDRRLRRMRQTRLIVALPEAITTNSYKLAQMFAQLWHLQFMLVIVLSGSTQLHSYKPYPHVQVYEILQLKEDFFPHLSTNLQGYNISTPVDNDIPRIFCIVDAQGQLHIKGFAYRLMSEFFRNLNAKLHISNPHALRSITNNVNISAIMQLLSNFKIEATLHPYTSMDERYGVLSYPVFKLRNCLIMPVQNEIPRSEYLLRPFQWSAWLLITIAIIYVSFILVWSSPMLQAPQRPFLERLSRALLESIAQILFIASLFRIYAPKWRYFFIYTLLAVLGFFTTAWYCNLLSSYLTTFLVGEQANTYEEFLKAKVPLMVKNIERTKLLYFVPDHLKQRFDHLTVDVDPGIQMSHLFSFNTSYSYPFTEERWLFFALQQQYANKPIFRFSDICFGTPWIGFPLRLDSHLMHPLNQFIMNVQMAGLDHYWLIADFNDALKAGYVRLLDNILPFKALDLNSLSTAWYMICIGWIIACTAFALELVYYYKLNQLL